MKDPRDYLSFEEVMSKLEMTEDDIKRMVSEGELRAFRDENKMKFKLEDVERVKKGRITEPTIILPSAVGPQSGSGETVIDFDMGDETGSGVTEGTIVDLPPDDSSTSFADTTTGISSKSTTTGLGPTQTMKIESAETRDISIDPTETYIDEEEDSALVTEPLKLADEESASDSSGFTAELVEEEVPPPPSAPALKLKKKKKDIALIPPEVEAELERRRPSFVWSILMFLTLLITLFCCLIFYDLARMENDKVDEPVSFLGDFAEWVMEGYWADQEYIAWHESEQKAKEENRLRNKLTEEAEKYYLGPQKLGPSFRHKEEPPPVTSYEDSLKGAAGATPPPETPKEEEKKPDEGK
ncbi:MAG: hypothetical protein A2Z34_10480 [Planctomycetes bacterium RBG_16_59_8]|nr:MAG: hypothetical protein A2Z34_10480 [Planctomycetes bacterium RBG_16_59_8]